MTVDPLIQSLKGKLVVSVQAYMGEPLRTPETMAQMSRACELGGAAAIRCQGLADIAAIKGRCEVPVIGLWKDGHEGVYITPTLRHARACVAAGADIVAIDAPDRPRPDGKTVEDTFRPLHEEGVLLMADCATIEDIRRAVDMGFDLVSTTLSHGVSCVRRLRNSPAFLSFARVACIRPRRLAPRSMLAPGPLSSAPPSRTPRVLRVGSRLHLRRKTGLVSARGGILNIGN
jgi:putative N-acetylmannosamine-6-phosphate epimerase